MVPRLRGLRPARQGQYGHVLQLTGEGVADRALIGRRGRETGLGEVVAAGQHGQDERGVDGREHARQPGLRRGVRGHDLGHRLRLDGVPQFDDGQAAVPRRGQPLQLGDEVLAQRAAGAVVDQGRLAVVEEAAGVPYGPADGACTGSGAGAGRREVVVEGDAAGDV